MRLASQEDVKLISNLLRNEIFSFLNRIKDGPV